MSGHVCAFKMVWLRDQDCTNYNAFKPGIVVGSGLVQVYRFVGFKVGVGSGWPGHFSNTDTI